MPRPLVATVCGAIGVVLGAGIGPAFGAASAVVPAAAASGSAAPPVPACVHVTKQAVYSGAGYDHVVSFDNTCDRDAACAVSTSVNPDAIAVRVEAKQHADVVTYRGSPASEFTAYVRCRLE